jgi:hypothetical protein
MYAGLAALVLFGVDALQRILALPPVFGVLARIGLAAGVPLAIVIAWRYPSLGADSSERPESLETPDRS